MTSIVVSAGVRNLLSQATISSMLERVTAGNDALREGVIDDFLEQCVFRDFEERRTTRDALRYFYWYTLEQVRLGRKNEADFVRYASPVFIRFCEGSPREMSDEDRKIARLIMATLYLPERDPLAQALA